MKVHELIAELLKHPAGAEVVIEPLPVCMVGFRSIANAFDHNMPPGFMDHGPRRLVVVLTPQFEQHDTLADDRLHAVVCEIENSR
jgi:hypothetical protein